MTINFALENGKNQDLRGKNLFPNPAKKLLAQDHRSQNIAGPPRRFDQGDQSYLSFLQNHALLNLAYTLLPTPNRKACI